MVPPPPVRQVRTAQTGALGYFCRNPTSARPAIVAFRHSPPLTRRGGDSPTTSGVRAVAEPLSYTGSLPRPITALWWGCSFLCENATVRSIAGENTPPCSLDWLSLQCADHLTPNIPIAQSRRPPMSVPSLLLDADDGSWSTRHCPRRRLSMGLFVF